MTELEQLKSENENLKQRLNLAYALIERDDFMYVQEQEIMEINCVIGPTILHVAVPSITEQLKTNFFETVNA